MAESMGDQPLGTVPRRRVTSADVAQAAGVSRTTVSYVLNDAPGRKIAPETRELVLRTASRLGHVPSAPGRSLRLGRSDIVLVLIRDFDIGYVAASLLKELDTRLAQLGYMILIDRYDPDLRTVSELWQRVSPALVVALGGLSTGLPAIDESEVKVASERFLPLQGTVPNVRVGELQAEYLATKGHRGFGYAFPASPSANMIATERYRGIKERCRILGMREPSLQVVDSTHPESVETAVDIWLADPQVSAVAAHSDELGLLICSSLWSRGLRPGVDLAVIGADDQPGARVALSTVRIDHAKWAVQVIAAVEALLDDRPIPQLSTDIIEVVERLSA